MLLVYLNNQMEQKKICIVLLQLYTINQFWTTEYLNLKSKAIKLLVFVLQVIVKYHIQNQKKTTTCKIQVMGQVSQLWTVWYPVKQELTLERFSTAQRGGLNSKRKKWLSSSGNGRFFRHWAGTHSLYPLKFSSILVSNKIWNHQMVLLSISVVYLK